MYGVSSVVDLSAAGTGYTAGASIGGTECAYLGTVTNAAGNPVNTQAGLKLVGSGTNVTNRYQLWLTDWGGTPSGDNYAILQQGSGPTNRLEAELTLGPSTQVAVDGSTASLGIVGDGNTWAYTASTWSASNAAVPGFVQALSRSNTVGTHTIVQSGNITSAYYAYGSNGSAFKLTGQLFCAVDGTPSSTSMPGRWQFYTTPSGSLSPSESFRLDNAGAAYFPRIGTTASAANAFINNASSPVNSLLRSTSSLRYKADVSEIPQQRLDALRALRPIEYRSLASADDPEMRFVGYAAEDVAAIDPALVATDGEGRPDGVMYDRVLLLQLAALQAEVDALKTRLM
jgi:hypothetical protein